MDNLLIAVAVAEDGQLAPHGGRAMRWQIYVKVDGAEPELAWTLNLSTTGSLHEWHVRADNERHPLHAVDVAIVGSAGEGVTQKLAARHTTLVQTAEKDPERAVRDYLLQVLAPGLEQDQAACLEPKKKAARRALKR